MTREYKNGRYFTAHSRDFDNGYRHKNNSVRTIPERAAIFENGVHQRDFGCLRKEQFQVIFDERYMARSNGDKRNSIFLKFDYLVRRAIIDSKRNNF